MGILYLLLPVALGLGLGAVVVFRWAVRDGQFDDLDTPPRRVLFDDTIDGSFDETGRGR